MDVGLAIEVAPVVGRRPCAIRGLRQRMRRRAEAERVEEQRLRIAFPAIGQEARLASPAVRHRDPPVLRPLPVHSPVQRVGELADAALVVGRAVEVLGGEQRARDQERRVDRRHLAVPRSGAAVHVEEVVVEAAAAGRVQRRPLHTVREERERGERAPQRLVARDPPALDADRIRREPEPRRGDAARPAGPRAIGDEPVALARHVRKILERLALHLVEQRSVGLRVSVHRAATAAQSPPRPAAGPARRTRRRCAHGAAAAAARRPRMRARGARAARRTGTRARAASAMPPSRARAARRCGATTRAARPRSARARSRRARRAPGAAATRSS